MDVPAACVGCAPGFEAVRGYGTAEPVLGGGTVACFRADADVAGVEVFDGVVAFEAAKGVGYVFAVDEGVVAGAARDGIDVEWHDTMLPAVILVTVGGADDGTSGADDTRKFVVSLALSCCDDTNDTSAGFLGLS